MSPQLRYLTAGESHGRGLVAILEGIPSGLEVKKEYINKELKRRQAGYGRGKRMKIEKDEVSIISGVRWGKTLGSPISFFIPNLDWKNWEKAMGIDELEKGSLPAFTRPRPGHADLVGGIKYNFSDLRNVLERASARETAARVATGAICKRLLEEFKVQIFSRLTQIGKEKDISNWQVSVDNYDKVEKSPLRCMNSEVEKRMIETIDKAKSKGDTLGGIFEVIVIGLPVGLGSYIQWDLKLDARLAFTLMSIQAIVGVEIGMGFKAACSFGSEVQDEIAYNKSRGFYRLSNRSGGIEGGMTTGEPLVMRVAMKPISTLRKPLQSIDIESKKKVEATKERSDICATPAASVIGEAICAIEITRAMQEKFGGDSLEEMKRNYLSYLEYVKKRENLS